MSLATPLCCLGCVRDPVRCVDGPRGVPLLCASVWQDVGIKKKKEKMLPSLSRSLGLMVVTSKSLSNCVSDALSLAPQDGAVLLQIGAHLAWLNANDAFGPVIHSNIKAMALLVEPQPHIYQRLAASLGSEARVRVEHAAVCALDASNVTFYSLDPSIDALTGSWRMPTHSGGRCNGTAATLVEPNRLALTRARASEYAGPAQTLWKPMHRSRRRALRLGANAPREARNQARVGTCDDDRHRGPRRANYSLA
jgi:hypothetical protein